MLTPRPGRLREPGRGAVLGAREVTLTIAHEVAMRRFLIAVGIAAFVASGCVARRAHYQANAFEWTGTVPAGQWLHVHNLNGTISVVAAKDANVEVHASKKWTHGGDEVHFVKNVGPDGVTICVLYHSGDDCSADQSSRSSRHHGLFSFHSSSDAQTDFVIDVPPGVNLELANVSGSVQASGTSGTVDARVVNGEINVASHEGALDLVTVNGSVTAALDTLPATGDISLKTVNGSVTAVLPSALNGFVSFETVTGHISDAFTATSNGAPSTKKFDGTIGTGGSRHVTLSTVNGSVSLLKHA